MSDTTWFFGIRNGVTICYGKESFDWGIEIDESQLPVNWELIFNERRLGYVDGVFEEFPEYVIGYENGEYIFEEVEDATP